MPTDTTIQQIPIKKIKLSRNSRLDVREDELSGLMSSIKEQGLLQPIGVVKQGTGYEVVFGNRRFLACQKLGLHSIMANVRVHDEESDFLLENVAENIQRRNISLLEVGRFFKDLKEQGLTDKEISVRLGVTKAYVQAASEAFQQVPEKYRSSIRESSTQRKRKMPGSITGLETGKILNARRTFGLDDQAVDSLFAAAKRNPKFRHEQIPEYAAALKEGKEDFIEEVRPIKNIAVHLSFYEDEYEQLVGEHIENGPFSSFTEVVVAALRGEKSIRMPIRGGRAVHGSKSGGSRKFATKKKKQVEFDLDQPTSN